MNKLAIAALVVSVISFFSQFFSPLLSGLGEQGALILFYTIPIVGLILGIVALRQIRRTGEKGKVIAWIAIGLASVRVIGIILLLGLGAALSYPSGSEAGDSTAQQLHVLQQQRAVNGQ